MTDRCPHPRAYFRPLAAFPAGVVGRKACVACGAPFADGWHVVRPCGATAPMNDWLPAPAHMPKAPPE